MKRGVHSGRFRPGAGQLGRLHAFVATSPTGVGATNWWDTVEINATKGRFTLEKNMDVSRNMPKKRMNTCQNAKTFETRDSCYIFLTCLFLGTQETSWFQPCFSRLELHPAGWWHFSWYSSSWATWWWARALHGLRAHQSPNAKNCSYSHEKNVPFSPVVLERSIIFCSKDFL